MKLRVNIKDLSNPQELERLISILTDMADKLDVLYTETAPDGTISARQGRIALYNNSGTYTTWINTTGSTAWQQISQEAAA